jgi:alkaline phosphatase
MEPAMTWPAKEYTPMHVTPVAVGAADTYSSSSQDHQLRTHSAAAATAISSDSKPHT